MPPADATPPAAPTKDGLASALASAKLVLAGLEASGPEQAAELMQTLQDALEPGATLLAPAHTLSLARDEVFDHEHTPSICGHLSERIRTSPGAVRSRDPLFSLAGLGPQAGALFERLPWAAFGPGCIWKRLLEYDALAVVDGLAWLAPLLHHLEMAAGVSRRYAKLLTGDMVQDGAAQRVGWLMAGRDRFDLATATDLGRLEALARDEGMLRPVQVAGQAAWVASCRELAALVQRALAKDAAFLAKGPLPAAPSSPPPLDPARRLDADASMEAMVRAVWDLPRDIVSPGYDQALDILTSQAPMTIHAYPSGAACWSWVVPEAWACRQAWLATASGERLFSYADCPLHVASYSLPVDREVSRDELLAHLHTHPVLPDAIPFKFLYYQRNWGLCCSKEQAASLTAESYRVRIDAQHRPGTLKVGEVVVPGRKQTSFVLCAHLCHPWAANDGLSGVAVGLAAMRALAAGPKPRHTYRLLILPETIGSLAWLSHNQALIPSLGGGLFLEMLGLDQPFALQLSHQEDGPLDQALSKALAAKDPTAWVGGPRRVVGNDERQFNAPGLRIPMLSLSRVLRPGQPGAPFPEYHTHLDSPAICPQARLEEALGMVMAMIAQVEEMPLAPPVAAPPKPGAPQIHYAGELFLSRYGIQADFFRDRQGHQALFDLLDLIDGQHTVEDIVQKSGASPETVQSLLAKLERHGLATLPQA